MNAERIISVSISEPDMDMNRGPGSRVKPSLLMTALRWFKPSLHMIETPRRSVDRELQEYSDSWQ